MPRHVFYSVFSRIYSDVWLKSQKKKKKKKKKKLELQPQQYRILPMLPGNNNKNPIAKVKKIMKRNKIEEQVAIVAQQQKEVKNMKGLQSARVDHRGLLMLSKK